MRSYLLGAVVFALSLANVESIIGGTNTKISNFPFYASIRMYPNKYSCGASIIGKQWVITAAQCVYGLDRRSLFVAVGTDSLNRIGASYAVDRIDIHPYFNRITKANDTALVRLTRNIVFNQNVSSILLASDIISTGKTLVLVGHGATSYPFKNPSSNLTMIVTRSIDIAQCGTILRQKLTKSYLCTLAKSFRGACVGDVGSPLVSRGGSFGSRKLYGVLSLDQSCARGGQPDVYSSITDARPWILRNTGL
ncbi:hypothetical protein PPYR_12860 [Photinus pyralis]|uniref:Peptidase S1 domain-containing protein n=1 Tax=Photinus pyralis TaxID=7054 RepID=A0A5N4A7E7_PHOPY|nr:chymotrypsin-2-like [Photinus pyralis]KAB0793240.1 hypothetical protein PPYR_12860 [Photinus pyralis]